MVDYFIGVGDGNRELLAAPAVLEPVTGIAASLMLGQGDIFASSTLTGGSLALAQVADDYELTSSVAIEGSVRVDISVLQGGTDSTVLQPFAFLIQALGITTSFGSGAIFGAPVLDGGLSLAVIPIPRVDLFAEQNDNKRPCLPWRVVRLNVGHVYDLTEDGGTTYKIPDNQPFVVSDDFQEDPDNPLLLLGGKRSYLGIILDDGMGGKAVRFRPPYRGEIIYNLDTSNPQDEDERGTYRYDADAGRWFAHRTHPQRALSATKAFDILDPDGIYDYLAELIGLTLAQHQYDTRRIGQLLDPARVPERFLPLLLRNFGADDIFADETFADQQEALRIFVALMKSKGTPSAIINALSLLGYVGHGSHVWAIPQGDPRVDWTCKPFGFDNVSPDPSMPTTEFFPTSGVCIHLNQFDGTEILKISDGVKQKVAEFLVRNILPAHTFIRAFATDVSVGSDDVDVSDSLTITP